MKISYRRCPVCHRRRRHTTVAHETWTVMKCSRGHWRRWQTLHTDRILKKVYLPMLRAFSALSPDYFRRVQQFSGRPFTVPLSMVSQSPASALCKGQGQ